MPTSNDIARYFLSLVDEDVGDGITNLKLQKLVYYAQGFHLAIYDRKLFDEPIQAWTHGPVVPDLYQIYKKYQSGPIPSPNDVDISEYDDNLQDLLKEIYSLYGQFSAWKLRDLTHEEPPWANAYERCKGSSISENEMKEYFKSLLVSSDGKNQAS